MMNDFSLKKSLLAAFAFCLLAASAWGASGINKQIAEDSASKNPHASSPAQQYGRSNSDISQVPADRNSHLQQPDTFKYNYVRDYTFKTLPFETGNIDELTIAQSKILISELKKRLSCYKRLITDIENKLVELGEPVNRYEDSTSKPEISKQIPAKPVIKGEDTSDEMPVARPDGSPADASEGVLIAEHKMGMGTAFIAIMRGKYFIVTNLHVIAENEGLTFKTKSNSNVAYSDTVFIANGLDAVLIPIEGVPAGTVALDVMEDISSQVKIGDAVVACGNSEGGEVLRRSKGKVLAIGPSVIETSCAIFHGNSGSPIYHKKSGKIIGVISHALKAQEGLDSLTREQENSPIRDKVRYFGQRIDNVKNWEKMSLSELNSQSKDLTNYARKFKIIQTFEESGTFTIYKELNYASYHKITRLLEGTASSTGAVRAARREYYEKTANLIKHEIALIKARKFSSVFSAQVAALIDAFELQRSLSLEKAKAQDL